MKSERGGRSREYFAAFRSFSHSPGLVLYEAFHFGDNEAMANGLAQLVLAGRKQAAAALAWSYEAEGRQPPGKGSLSIVQSWSGEPLCIIETTSAEIVPFEEVGKEFAASEGEGDRSLGHWRSEHWKFFGRECLRLGKEPGPGMTVVCERFAVVQRAQPEN